MAKEMKDRKVQMMEEQLQKKLTRQVVASLVGCVHCGMCNDSCHYVHAADEGADHLTAELFRQLLLHHLDLVGLL